MMQGGANGFRLLWFSALVVRQQNHCVECLGLQRMANFLVGRSYMLHCWIAPAILQDSSDFYSIHEKVAERVL